MPNRFFSPALAIVLLAAAGAGGQPSHPAAYSGPRASDGKPDLNGIWQTLNTADWDLRAHAAGPSPVLALGAVGAEPPGLGVIEGGDIPYQPWAAAKQKENAQHWLTADPEIKCYLPGVPRATYQPYPFQIVQTPRYVLIAYEFASASRSIPIAPKKEEAPADSWMGDSYGRWDGDTLVVDVTSFTDQSWFDRAGDFHSDALHVVERYAPLSRDVLMYEALIEDPKVFTRPWKISMPLYRHVEKNAQLLEFKCVEFVEELMYGPLRKKAAQ
ncbi:MAG: hypothetical protein ABSB86_04640 [Bryobacteraceae bacterium]|jgi:hypothetical protein